MSSEATTIISAHGAFNVARLDNAQLNGHFSPIEQEGVKQLLSEAMRKLEDLEGQSSPKDEATSAERREQTVLINQYRAVLAPYKKLPVEILASVFLAYGEGPRDRRYTYAHVCRTWRRVALSTPSLWNRIWVNYLHSETVFKETRMAKELISRSGGLPIELGCRVGPDVVRRSARYEADLLNIITSISTRLSSLSLTLSKKCAVISELFHWSPGLFDQLETLKVHASIIWRRDTEEDRVAESIEPEDSANTPGIVVFSNAPNLRAIDFYTPFQTWGAGTVPTFHAPWGQLTALKLLAEVAMDIAHTILVQCNLLGHCEIMVVDNPRPAAGGVPAHIDNISLHSLQSFTVMVRFVEDDCAVFIKPFILPALLSLRFTRWRPAAEWTQYQSVSSLIDRSDCRLQSFSTSFEIVDEHIKPLLEKMPTLTELKLMFNPMHSATWPHPTYISSATLQLMSCGELVPKLRSLECPVAYPNLFVDMLERRESWYAEQYPEGKDGGIQKFQGKCIFVDQGLKIAIQRLLELERGGPGRSYNFRF